MDEFVARLLVVGGVGGAAGAWALIARRGRAWRRRPIRPSGIGPGLHLFSSAGCASCARARSILVATGRPFLEHTYESDEQVLQANGIVRVPTVVFVAGDPPAGWAAEGVPSARALSHWLGP